MRLLFFRPLAQSRTLRN